MAAVANPLSIRDHPSDMDAGGRHVPTRVRLLSCGSQAVFISYASQDCEAAGRICEALRAAGLEVWFDQSDLRGGDAWDAAIRKQVKECALFVALISANTQLRGEGYFRREWNLAVSRMLDMADDQSFLLPVVIDETPEATARVPDRFRERQWTRLAGGLTLADFGDRVVRLLTVGRARASTGLVAKPVGAVDHRDRPEEGFWVAVLPFKCAGDNADLAAFAEALAEEIVTGLCRFSYLRVIARSSTSRYAGAAADVRTIGKEVGARYTIEGSLRQAGPRLRLAVQLVDTVSGAHLWAESYERGLSSEAAFELQDELASRIVSTVADLHGILPRSLSELVRGRSPESLSPYEAVLRSFSYPQRPSPEELVPAREGLEAAVRKAPSNGDAWAMLSFLCVQDYAHGFNLRADALVRGLAAAQRAIEAAPNSHLAYFALAQALFFHKETQSFRKAVERAIALNPMDGNSLAFLGEMLAYSGSSERGLELAARAKQLNPSHPGWYWYVDVYNAYRQGDYQGALGFVLNVNLPDHWPMYMFLAAVYGQLGDAAAASKALRQLLRVRPNFPATGRADLEKWWDAGFVEHLAGGWRKGGLEMEPPVAPATPAQPSKPSIAVMPFANLSGDPEQDYFVDGMVVEIVEALSRIRAIFVIGGGSTLSLKGNAASAQDVGRQFGVRYVLEGSVRKAGDRVRIGVQLTDAGDGMQIWTHRFEETLDDVFVLQDKVALAVAGKIEPTVEQAEIRRSSARPTDNVDSYDLYLRAVPLFRSFSKAETLNALELLNRAIALDPNNGPALALAASCHRTIVLYGWSDDADSNRRQGLEFASRVLKAAGDDATVLASVANDMAFLKQDPRAAVAMVDRAVALNPGSANVWFNAGFVRLLAGDLDLAVENLENATRLDPTGPNRGARMLYTGMARFYQHRFDEAVALLKERNQLSESPGCYALLAASYGQLGNASAGGEALRRYQALTPRPIDSLIRSVAFDPTQLKLVLDGIALARA